MHAVLAQSTGGGGDAAAFFLVSWWKPLAMLAVFVVWAYIVATVYDKDAKKWLLGQTKWNLIHLTAGALAWAAALASPSFVIALPVFVLVLLTDLVAYWMVHNRSERVPEKAHWRFTLEGLKALRSRDDEKSLVKGLRYAFRGPDGLLAAPEKETPEYEVRLAAETIIADAVESRASRFDLAPAQDKRYSVTFIIDGVRKTGEPLPAAQAVAVIDFFKTAAGLDVTDRRRRQVGEFQVERETARRVVRVVTLGDARGQRLQGVFDPAKQVDLSVDELGLLPKQREALQEIIDEKKGVVLLATPPLGGRTTLLYAVLRAHDAYLTNIQTVEMQPEIYIDGVRQNKFDPLEEGAEYATTVRSILRRDPDIVAVAELPDAETAKTIATVNDHEHARVFLALRGDSAMTAIAAYVKAVGDAKAAGKSLYGVVAQRLLRKLCVNCKAEYQPTADILRKLNLPPDKVKKLYKKGGQVLVRGKPEICPMCSGVGYFGQTGVHEVFPLGLEEREAIAQQDWASLRTLLRKRRLPSLQEAALNKLVQGVTSVEEIVRVTSQGNKAAAGRSSSTKESASKAAQQQPASS